jgi:hypothetical protein
LERETLSIRAKFRSFGNCFLQEGAEVPIYVCRWYRRDHFHVDCSSVKAQFPRTEVIRPHLQVHVMIARPLRCKTDQTADQPYGRPQEVLLGLIKIEFSSLIVGYGHGEGNALQTLIGLLN